MSRPILEICAGSVEDCLAAEANGADRLELNAALALGGLTPSLGMLWAARLATRLPLIAMVRPRPGGFVYSASEFHAMSHDAPLAIANGADGVAFGILEENGAIDVERCRSLLEVVRPGEAVFHRAFDWTVEPLESLETLIDLGFDRVLTSGQAATAVDGCDRLAELVRAARGRIVVLPGGGIRSANVGRILAQSGAREIHASCSAWRSEAGPLSLHYSPQEGFPFVDGSAVKALREAVDAAEAGR
jgi:copper homeostasis protein